MNTELEDTLTEALRSRADAVPPSPMPQLGVRAAAPPPRRGWVVPVAAALAVILGIGIAALALNRSDNGQAPVTGAAAPDPTAPRPGEVYYSVQLSATGANGVIIESQLWQPPDRAGAWQQKTVAGRSIKDGRVAPSDDRVEAPAGGPCYPATSPGDERCTAPGDWFNPTPDFLTTAPRDPATIAEQLRAAAIAEEHKRTGPGGDFTPSPDTLSDQNLNYLTLNYLRGLLATNGVPTDLAPALRRVIAAMPGITVTENVANLLGEHGTGYSLPNHKGEPLTVIFDDHDTYRGSPTEAVHHGIAPGLGQPPSRMID